MNLGEIFAEKAVVLDLKSRDKNGAIRELVDELQRTGSLAKRQVEKVLSALYEREKLGSTGIGKGMAVPHAKHGSVKRVIGIMGLSKEGVEYRALDGQLVHVVFLFLSNPDSKEEHIRVLECLSSLLREEDLCRFIRAAKTQKEAIELLQEAGQRLEAG